MNTVFLRGLVAVLIAATVGVPLPRVEAMETAPQPSALAFAGGMGGNVWAVAQNGPYAYVAEGNRLVVLDVRDPARVVRVGQAPLSGVAFKLTAVGSTVAAFHREYVSTFAIQLIDVTNPWQPTPRSRYENLKAADAFGALLYMATFNQLQVVDLQDAARPTQRGSYALNTDPTALLATENMLYLATCIGLETIDVTQPDALQHRGSTTLPGCANALDKAGQFVYATGGQQVWVVEVREPMAPQLRAGAMVNGFVRSIKVIDGTAFTTSALYPGCCELLNAVTWFDVRDPAALELLGTYPVTATTSLVSPEGFLYIGTPTGLSVLDVSDPRRVTARATYPIDGGVNDLILAGQRVYIVAPSQGLPVLDMADPDKPILLPGYRAPLSSVRALRIVQETAFVSDGQQLALLSLRDPTNPVPRARLTLSEGLSPMQVRAEDGIAYVALKGSLWLLDIHDPDAPLLLARVDGPAQDVAVAGSVATVAAGLAGVTIVDVSNPTRPLVIATYATAGEATRVWRNGDLAYVIDTTAGLLAIDVSQPRAPRLRGSYPLSVGFHSMVVVGALAYIHRGDAVEVIDLSVPDAPRLRGRSPAPIGGMWLEGDRLYISTYRHLGPGADATVLAVVDVQNPDQPRLLTDKLLGGYGSIMPYGKLVFFTQQSRYAPGELQTIDTTTPGLLQVLDRYPLACGYGQHQRVDDLLYLGCGEAGLTIVRAQPQILPVQAQIGLAGGALRSFDDSVRLALPPAALLVTATVRYQGQREPTHPLPLTQGVVHAFTLAAADDAGAPVGLQHAATLAVTYSTSMLTAASIRDVSSLALVRWNGSSWQRLTPCDACSFDPTAHRLAVPVGALGEFALVGERSVSLLPLVQKGDDQ